MSFFKVLQKPLSVFKKTLRGSKEALTVLNKPHHSSTLSIRGFLHSLLVTLVVTSLGFLIRPFGLKQQEAAELTNTVITAGGITFIMMILAQFLFPLIIKDFYVEEKWTTGKQLTQLLVMSGLVSLATVFYLYSKALASFPLDAFVLFGLSIIPLGILAVIQQNLLHNKFERLAMEKNEELKRKGVVNSENPLNVLAFRGNGQKLNLIPNQLIYIRLGDVSEFYYQNILGVEKSSMTVPRQAVLEELKGHPQFEVFRGDIIVNVNAIRQVSGSARGYDLEIARIDELVKVSHKDRKKVDKL